jgi:hypothetical protein
VQNPLQIGDMIVVDLILVLDVIDTRKIIGIRQKVFCYLPMHQKAFIYVLVFNNVLVINSVQDFRF